MLPAYMENMNVNTMCAVCSPVIFSSICVVMKCSDIIDICKSLEDYVLAIDRDSMDASG